MNLENKYFITKGVASNVSPLLQLFMWECVRAMPPPKDYLQIFEISYEFRKTKIKHTQEIPAYKREYLLNGRYSFFIGKIYVIDDGTHQTMLLSDEY